jgi:iron(III) transport system ATP-binding protein
MTPRLEARRLVRRYRNITAVRDLSLSLGAGEVTCLLGPSGCGKSTLLRLLAGLERPDEGLIVADGVTLSGQEVHSPAESRDIGLVFQDHALFPHLSALDNVAFGLADVPKPHRRPRALAALEQVQMGHRAHASPGSLSGGERQRVALARTLVRGPAVVLMDEPLSGLDGALRTEVRAVTLEALKRSGAAVLIVTHDPQDALMTADTLILMREGEILQTGAPQDCYFRPRSVVAARLLGDVNVLTARMAGSSAVTAFGPLAVDRPVSQILARPEALVLSGDGVQALVVQRRFAGSRTQLVLTSGGEIATGYAPPVGGPSPGDRVGVVLDPAACTGLD